MKKLFTSTLLTVAAVPFLMAAPHAAKKVQNTAAPTSTTAPSATSKTKVKKVKKAKTAKTANTDTAAASTSTQK